MKYIIPCMLSLQPLKNLNYVWNTYLVKCHKYAWLLVELWTEYLDLFFQKKLLFFCTIWEAPLNHVECKSRKMLNNKISCHKLTQTHIFHFFSFPFWICLAESFENFVHKSAWKVTIQLKCHNFEFRYDAANFFDVYFKKPKKKFNLGKLKSL